MSPLASFLAEFVPEWEVRLVEGYLERSGVTADSPLLEDVPGLLACYSAHREVYSFTPDWLRTTAVRQARLSEAVALRARTVRQTAPLQPLGNAAGGSSGPLCRFARDLLAADLRLDGPGAADVRRLRTACRALLQQPDPEQSRVLGWVSLERFLGQPDLLSLLIEHRDALPSSALPPSGALVRSLFNPAGMRLFVRLFNQLTVPQQRQLLGNVATLEYALRGTAEMGHWYRGACEPRRVERTVDALWDRCCHPVTVSEILRPCPGLLFVHEQIAWAADRLNRLVSSVTQASRPGLCFPEGTGAARDELRVLAMLDQAAQVRPGIVMEWLQRQSGPMIQAVLLFLYARHDHHDSLAALGRELGNCAGKEGMSPDARLLTDDGAPGCPLIYHVFTAPGALLLDTFSRYIDLKHLALVDDGSMDSAILPCLEPGSAPHPLCFVLPDPGGQLPLSGPPSAQPDRRWVMAQLHRFVGLDGLQEILVRARNRGTPAWWAWLVECLQRYPELRCRLARDRRADRIRVGKTVSMPLPRMLASFHDPFAPLVETVQQQRQVQALLARAQGGHKRVADHVQALLSSLLILYQPPVCRALLHQLLTGEGGRWPQLRDNLFDGHSTRFDQLRDLLVASWCDAGTSALARAFEVWQLDQQADPLYASRSRHSQSCLDARRYPTLFGRPAVGVRGSSLWFEDEQGVLTLKLHSKGQSLTDLLRESWTLTFLAQVQDRLPLVGERPEPLGCGWLPDFLVWLADSGLDAASQQAVRDRVEIAEDGAVWGVVLRTTGTGYHRPLHELEKPDDHEGAGQGLQLAARDAGTLLRHGLVPTGLVPLCHRLPWGDDQDSDGSGAWQFLCSGLQGVIEDWDGTGTGQALLAPAPWGLAGWAGIRTRASLSLDPAVCCKDVRWQTGTLLVNEAGRILTGLTLVLARLQAHRFDCTDPQQQEINRNRLRSGLLPLLRAFLTGLTADSEAVECWARSAETQRLQEAAVRQIVFWCETGEAPSFSRHLADVSLPCDIPCDYAGLPDTVAPWRSSVLRNNTLTDHRRLYPLTQLTALIYLVLGHGIAAGRRAGSASAAVAGPDPAV